MASVGIRDVRKAFGATEVIHGVSIDIEDGEFVVLVGPSGCGKSTLLRMIAGLENITGGEIKIGERVVNDLPPKERDIAMVFQNYALYPHMTVADNMALLAEAAQRPARGDRSARQARGRNPRPHAAARSAIRASCPAASASASPWAAPSCAIRRCSCSTSRCPISTPSCASPMRTEIKELHQRLGTTTVYVTHDQIEAMTMADKIVVMHDGIVEQIGAPLELYDRPDNLFVAGFIGSPAMNFLKGRISPNGAAAFEDRGRRETADQRRARALRRPAGRLRHPARAFHASPTTAPRPRSWWSSRPARKSRSSPSSAATEIVAVFRERHHAQARRQDPAPARAEARASVRRGDRQTAGRLNVGEETSDQ